MPARSDSTPELPGFHFAPTVVPTGRPDGAVLVIPGKAVAPEQLVSIAEAARLTGYSKPHLQRLFRGRNRGPGCKIKVSAKELEKLKPRV